MASPDLPPLDPQLTQKYPAKVHCRRVARLLDAADGTIYLESQKEVMTEDDDQARPFRQRRAFYYLSGCNLPDTYLTYDIAADHLTLFIPPIDSEAVMWAGLPLSKDEALSKFDIDEVRYSDEVNAALAHAGNATSTPNGNINDSAHKSPPSSTSTTTIYAIPEQISSHITFLNFTHKNLTSLRSAINESRVLKDPYEVALIRRANQISTLGHVAAQRVAHTAKNEEELYGTFVGTCICNGAHEQAYHSICASGHDCATLHYVRNDKGLEGKLNVLMDAGAEYGCYCADVTRTFPARGEGWTKESKQIYDIVKDMQDAAYGMIRAGVRWEDVHAETHRVLIHGLTKLGVLKGGTEEEIFKSRVSCAFYPHGLGHMLGMDTHDTGGNANYEDEDVMFRYLRIRRKLEAGMVVTNEPGCYFNKFLIQPVLEDEHKKDFVDEGVLKKYWDVGGVRIEDDVLVTEDGYENLSCAPKL